MTFVVLSKISFIPSQDVQNEDFLDKSLYISEVILEIVFIFLGKCFLTFCNEKKSPSKHFDG